MDWDTRILKHFLISAILNIYLAHGQIYQNLGLLNVDRSPVTISGFSSGGNMAQQMQVAFSSCFKGSAAFAAVPYHCGINGYRSYRFKCNLGFRTVNNFVKEARQFELEGKIDPLSNLKHQYHYHYIPKQDTLVLGHERIRANTGEFFRRVGMNPVNIHLFYKNSDHWMPTKNKGLPFCDDPIRFKVDVALLGRNTTGASFCNYDGAYEALSFLFQSQLIVPRRNGISRLQPLVAFSQTQFLNSADAKFLDPIGYLYIPTNCTNGRKRCKFHVALHGCRGSRSAMGDGFVTQSGYLEVAETNDIVILFPQSIPFDGNPDGCWDAFEATGPEFATKLGKQMRALMAMIQTVTGIQGCR
ncbi:unnamed protein product [Allacma fusca]|uniref:Carboxylic ester hydrolase n=1 Tax=Allacma fusca TaxID=39272 RepID=A0A8J2L3C7_9HEXA|nr:unnamed protein product [Allacma fusca]